MADICCWIQPENPRISSAFRREGQSPIVCSVFVCGPGGLSQGRPHKHMSAALSNATPLDPNTARKKADEKPAAEPRTMARAVIELVAARRKILMYPVGPPQIHQAADRAFRTFEEILHSRPEGGDIRRRPESPALAPGLHSSRRSAGSVRSS